MELSSLFDLFFANVNGDYLRTKPRSDLSIHVRNVVRVLRAQREPLAPLAAALGPVLTAWDPRVIGPLVAHADIEWLDGGTQEALLRELLQELVAELSRADT
jgi:hypothetical protein